MKFDRSRPEVFIAKNGRKVMAISVDPLPSRQSDVETTSKRRQRMSSNRRRKRVENANGIDVEKSTSFQRLEIDVVSTSRNRRRNNVRGSRRIDVEKGLKTQTESTLRNRRSFNVEKSTSFQRREIDVVSTSLNRRRFNVYESMSFQRL